ncbi:phage Hau3 resistance protein [Ectopseudomonas mendocina]|uniref:AAA family ATPase n=1 Tax=Ectopseudomonas mendocina TaxID=300 RepID=UPI000E005EF5|nr:AAA family ATPase [Pseudomonas mendocina]SUD35839.1 phage Hau3 resistance protein [Pseudomonas mendocina]
MKFKVIPREKRIPDKGINQAYLKIDHWNDFSFVTMFYLSVHDQKGNLHNIGNIKIGFKGQDTSTSTYRKLESEFTDLSDSFFSVGESLEFYKKISKLPQKLKEKILSSLNDIVFNPELIDDIQEEVVFGTSLLRDTSLTSIKGQFRRILYGKAELTDFNFAFERSTYEATASIKLDFDVTESSTPSTNIHALIGRNGSGKTTILNGMIQAVTNPDDTFGKFIDTAYRRERPIESDYFSSLISVSFSAFDPFDPPEEQPDPSKGTCYFYVGLKNREKNGIPRTIPELRADFVQHLVDCFRKKDKLVLWREAIMKLGTDENFESVGLIELEKIYKELREKQKLEQVDRKDFRDLFLLEITHYLKSLSSGHSIVLFTITKIISVIEEKTLILIDEPESHLHPPLLSAFIRTLSELLHDLNGVAIIATHSPVLLQEVPKSCVWKINRVGDTLKPYRPEIETFGENVGVLTREVFGLEVVTSGYHSLMSKAVNSGKSYERIIKDYNNTLGLEARTILKTMVLHRDKGLKQ